MKALIPVAGLGTRFIPASKSIPKEMLPIVDKPTIQYIVEEAVESGLSDIVLVSGRHKEAIEDHFDHAFELETKLKEKQKLDLLGECNRIVELANIISIRQKKPLGLGHAVLSARPVVGNEPAAVMLGDDVFDGTQNTGIGQLMEVFQKNPKKAVVAVMEVATGEEHKYGIVDAAFEGDKAVDVKALVEKPTKGRAPSRMAIIGRYILPATIWDVLENTKQGHGGEIQLTDALATLAETSGVVAVPIKGKRYDAGDKVGYLHANLAFAMKREELREPLKLILKEFLS